MLKKRFGKNLFNLGIFLLASAPSLSLVLIFIASILSSFKRSEKIFANKYNLCFAAAAFFMLITCLISRNLPFFFYTAETNNYLSWIGLTNWIPFFWIFWAIQPYLSTEEDRELVGFSLICSTVPVLASGFSQLIFDIHGPFKTLGGLIIWYQRDHGPVITGLFSNQNYTGCWLALVLPFSILFLLKKQKFKILTFLSILITTSIIFMILLTHSRGALSSVLISLTLLFPSKIFSQTFLICLIFIGALSFSLFSLFPSTIKEIVKFAIPNQLIDKLLITGPRIEIWGKSINFIKKSPIIGFGAGTFPLLYSIYGGLNDGQHSHNLFLQLSYDYGLPAALLIFIPFFLILFKSAKLNYFNRNEINTNCSFSNKIWLNSLLIFFMIHTFDITYFDGRISFLFWLLLSGNYCINKEFSEI